MKARIIVSNSRHFFTRVVFSLRMMRKNPHQNWRIHAKFHLFSKFCGLMLKKITPFSWFPASHTLHSSHALTKHEQTMKSSNENIFRVTGPLCGKFTVTGEFPSQIPVTRSFGVSLICAWTNGWVNNRDFGELGHHRAHYGSTVMKTPAFCRRVQRKFLNEYHNKFIQISLL